MKLLKKKLEETPWEETEIDLEAEIPKGKHKGQRVKEIFCIIYNGTDPIFDYAIPAVKNPLAKLILIAANRICDGIAAKNCGKQKTEELS
jgi:hypothetical protein